MLCLSIIFRIYLKKKSFSLGTSTFCECGPKKNQNKAKKLSSELKVLLHLARLISAPETQQSNSEGFQPLTLIANRFIALFASLVHSCTWCL